MLYLIGNEITDYTPVSSYYNTLYRTDLYGKSEIKLCDDTNIKKMISYDNYTYFTSSNILRYKVTWYKCNVDGSNLLPINLDVGLYKGQYCWGFCVYNIILA